jgi:hypothetical protein
VGSCPRDCTTTSSISASLHTASAAASPSSLSLPVRMMAAVVAGSYLQAQQRDP